VLIISKRNSNKVEENEIDDTEKEEELKGKSIFVKVSDETRAIIDKYKDHGMTISNLITDAVAIYDEFHSLSQEISAIIEKHREEGQSLVDFLERAIRFYGDQKNRDRDLWIRARDEMKMMLIGKTTFNQLIAAAEEPMDALEKPFKSNIAFDLILWYNNSRPLKSLSIEEILKTIQKVWVVANYFYTIDVTKESEDEYHLLFRHRQDKRYSRYWLGYFTELFQSKELPQRCLIEGQAFDESISIMIKVGYDK
jgi:hypothetical protein